MQVVDVNLDTANLHAHKGEALGGQAVARVEVALVPLGALEAGPVVVGDCVEAIAKDNGARGGGAEGVVVGGVDVRVVGKVLLHVDNVEAVLGQGTADVVGVDALVARHAVVVEEGGQAGDVVGQDVEGARGLGDDGLGEARGRSEEVRGTHLGCCGPVDRAVNLRTELASLLSINWRDERAV